MNFNLSSSLIKIAFIAEKKEQVLKGNQKMQSNSRRDLGYRILFSRNDFPGFGTPKRAPKISNFCIEN